MDQNLESLSSRIESLTPAQLAKVEEFVASLESDKGDLALRRAAASSSEPAFAAIWSNPEDDAYDEL